MDAESGGGQTPAAEDRSVSMLGANLLVLVSAGPIVVFMSWLFAARWGAAALVRAVYDFLTPGIFFPAAIVGVVAHELIHALAWKVFARRPASDIRFGFAWRTFTPYAHLKGPMPVEAYRAGAIAPAVLQGFLPAIVAIWLGTPLLMVWSLLFVLAAGGDFVALWLIRRVPRGRLVRDHPTRVGCEVLT